MSSSSNTGYDVTAEVAQLRARRTLLENTWLLLKSAPPTAIFGMIVIVFYVLVALFAPMIAPFGEPQIVGGPYEPWSSKYLLGTDQLGRDMFSRVVYGARNTIGIAILTTILSFLIGTTLGTMAAYARGWMDQLLSRGVDVLMAIPNLIFALMLFGRFRVYNREPCSHHRRPGVDSGLSPGPCRGIERGCHGLCRVRAITWVKASIGCCGARSRQISRRRLSRNSASDLHSYSCRSHRSPFWALAFSRRQQTGEAWCGKAPRSSRMEISHR